MEIFFTVMTYVAYVSLGISGAMVAIDREADLFGVIFLGLSTAFGGGIVRDMMLGRVPSFFTSYVEIAVTAGTALCVFLIAAGFKRRYVAHEALVTKINNVFDALGLGTFCTLGVATALAAGQTAPFIAIVMGMITGTGGGVFRDLCLGDVPFILRKRVYAIAALAGSGVYYLLLVVLGLGAIPAALLAIAVTFVLRLCATVFKWNMPKAIRFSTMTDGQQPQEK